jgi:NAD(P)H-flavin reductase
LIKPALQLSAPYRVVSNRAVARRMWEVAIEPQAGSALDFAPGQFVWLNLGRSPFSVTEHPFSISSAPSERPRIAFTIKESGDFTDRIGQIAVGTRAFVDGPHGNFTLAGRSAARLVFIAGGVGFAPIVGMLRQLREEGDPRPVTLVYGNRIEDQILYRDELAAMGERLDFAVHLVLSEPPEGWAGKVGELTPGLLRDCLPPDAAGTLYFVCGPVAMMDSVERSLEELGVPPRRIVTERFKYE